MSTSRLESESTREYLVNTALSLLDSTNGAGFTLRELAKDAGVSHTVVYKHFRSKDGLLAQAFVSLYTEEVLKLSQPDAEPRDRLEALCSALRRSYLLHPRLVSSMVAASGEFSQSKEFQLLVLDCMRGMGVDEARIAIYYQALESYVIGGSYFDFHAFPEHLSERRRAYSALGYSTAGSSSDSEVAEHNERVFALGLSALLDHMTAPESSSSPAIS